MTVARPVLRYHGGKWKLAPWIISHFPAHRVYVESYGGAASVLLRKQRAYAEVYNDLDGEIVNLFRVLRNPAQARELVRLVRLTPYARSEFDESYIIASDPIEQARRLLVRSWQGFGARGTNGMNTGFRTGFRKSGSTGADNWCDFPASVPAVVERLCGVTIENRQACDVMRANDSRDTLHYVDPPYVWDTRNTSKVKGNPVVYRHEMTDDDHRELAVVLHGLKGIVALSGYASPLYSELYADWQCVERAAFADGARKRTELLWLNRTQNTLFTQTRNGEEP